MTPPGQPIFSTDLYLPRYRAMRAGDWEIKIAEMALVPSYWGTPTMTTDLVSLIRGRETWMSISPLEIESAEIGIRLARGHVLIFGLGMGWAAAATAMHDAVTHVTIVERDREILELHRMLDLFAQLPEPNRSKIHIVEGDALTYRPDHPVDLLMPDIWLPLVSDGRVDEVRAMQANVGAKSLYFWGQELEIARHASAAGQELDSTGIAATIAGFDLPLVGLEWPDYPALVGAAASRWMRGRWLSGA